MIPHAPDGYYLIPAAAFDVFCGIVALACVLAFLGALIELLSARD